jgi:hypothetical protein
MERSVVSVSSGGKHKQPRRGGRDPEVPTLLLTHWQVTGLVQIGHTADIEDPDAPIVVHECPVIPGADGVASVDARCRHCVARLIIARGEDRTLLVLQHEGGCPELARLLAMRQVPR